MPKVDDSGLDPRVGKKGNTLCLFYGAGSVFLLRSTNVERGAGWLLKRDTFLYGQIELSETPKEARGADEVFKFFEKELESMFFPFMTFLFHLKIGWVLAH